MKARIIWPCLLVAIIAAAMFRQGYHGLGLAFGAVAVLLALIAALFPDAL